MNRRTALVSIGAVASISGLAGCAAFKSPQEFASEDPEESSPKDITTLERITVENEGHSERRISIDVVYEGYTEYTTVRTIAGKSSVVITDEWPKKDGSFVALCYSITGDTYHLSPLNTTNSEGAEVDGYEIEFVLTEGGAVTGNATWFPDD
ncbi:hypothetical protein [Halosolutus halophilus]|uniref:hypothetical protein n=1 Tax=Halosolutus halophilus TaxID=1552990 RepID=UPI0022350278|nr:hypothetical protein [Halosolutus halophilus]